MSKIFIIVGFIFILVGFFWPYIKALHLGSLPGDIIIKKENFSFYFPIVTCILLSGLLSLILWFFSRK